MARVQEYEDAYPVWDYDLEMKLKGEWEEIAPHRKQTWMQDRAIIRRGWDYTHHEAGDFWKTWTPGNPQPCSLNINPSQAIGPDFLFAAIKRHDSRFEKGTELFARFFNVSFFRVFVGFNPPSKI